MLKRLCGRHSTRRTSTEFSSKIGPDGNKQGNLARLRRRPATWAVRLHPRPVDECSEDIGGVITTDLFAFLTAMPVILTTPDEIETWLTAPCEQARKLQRLLPAGILRTVSVGTRKTSGTRAAGSGAIAVRVQRELRC